MGDRLFVVCYNVLREALSDVALALLEQKMQFDPQQLSNEFSRKHVTAGLLRGKAEDVLEVLDARGIAVTDAQRERVLACAELDTLRTWVRRAATVTNADELFVD